MKNKLEASYLDRHSIKRQNAYRSFLCDCRKLEQFLHRNKMNGLKYLLFVPKLTRRLLKSSKRDWQVLEIEAIKSGLLSDIGAAIDRHCPNWFEILKDAYPDHLISFTISQGYDALNVDSERLQGEGFGAAEHQRPDLGDVVSEGDPLRHETIGDFGFKADKSESQSNGMANGRR